MNSHRKYHSHINATNLNIILSVYSFYQTSHSLIFKSYDFYIYTPNTKLSFPWNTTILRWLLDVYTKMYSAMSYSTNLKLDSSLFSSIPSLIHSHPEEHHSQNHPSTKHEHSFYLLFLIFVPQCQPVIKLHQLFLNTIFQACTF